MQQAIDKYVHLFLLASYCIVFSIVIGQTLVRDHREFWKLAREIRTFSCAELVDPYKDDSDNDRGGAMEDHTEIGEADGTREEEEEDSPGAAHGHGRLWRGSGR